MTTRTCFVIAPIGKADSEIRCRSDQVLELVITPAVRMRGYEAVRADRISSPGVITDQVIQLVMDAPLVVADLTGGNPNVFYELAVRHAVQKPLIQLIEQGEPIPFDIGAMRTIALAHRKRKSVNEAKKQIVRQIDALQKAGDIDSPISQALHKTVGDLLLPAWRGHKRLDVLVPNYARHVVFVGQNLASRLGLKRTERIAFVKDLRVLLGRGTRVTLVIMPPSVLRAVHPEAAEDLERFTLPALEHAANALGPLAKRVEVVFHPAATLSTLAIDGRYGYIEPKFQRTAQIADRLTVKLGPTFFDRPSLDRMLYDAAKRHGEALELRLDDAAEELRSQLASSGILAGRSNTYQAPGCQEGKLVRSRERGGSRGRRARR